MLTAQRAILFISFNICGFTKTLTPRPDLLWGPKFTESHILGGKPTEK